MVLDGLTEEQRRAVTHPGGPLLVVAGAGAGKTRVLTHRLAWLVDQGVDPSEIVALTFSSQAAEELRTRAEGMIGRAHDALRVMTFHSFAGDLARIHGVEHGLLPPAVWASEEERALILLERIGELGLVHHDLRGAPGQVVSDILGRIERCKNELVSADDFVRFADLSLQEAGTRKERRERERDAEFARAYQAHDRWLAEEGLVDFGEAIVRVVGLLTAHRERLDAVRGSVRHLLVDEFQDTDYAQSQLLYLIGDSADSLVAVGDDDQGIYRFRGASTKNINDFRQRYPNRSEVRLERNHRSTQTILDAAHALVSPVPDRADKRLVALPEASGPLPRFWVAPDEAGQARAVVAAIEAYAAEGVAFEEQAILMDSVRTEAPAFVRALEAAGIPHQVHGGLGIFERREVREAMAWLRALVDPDDAQAHLRLAADPALALPWGRAADAVAMASGRGETVTGAFVRLAGELGVTRFPDLLDVLGPAVTGPPSELVRHVIDVSGVRSRALALGGAEGAARLSGLAAFERLAGELVARESGIDAAELVRRLMGLADVGHRGRVERTPERIGVQVSTIHQAKGLEFDVVFVVGLVAARVPGRDRHRADIPDGLLPEAIERGRDAHIAEKRRLFYVALTRPRRHLVLSTYEMGERTPQRPSPFWDEARAALGDPDPDHVGDGPHRAVLAQIASARETLERAVRAAAVARAEGRDDSGHSTEVAAAAGALVEAQTAAFLPATAVEASGHLVPGTECPDGPAAAFRPNPAAPAIDISPSDLQTYRICPLRYRYARVDRIPGARTVAGTVGTALHLALEAHYRPGGRGGDGQALVGRFAAELARLGVADTAEGKQALARAETHLPAYHDNLVRRGVDIRGVERRFTLPLGRHTIRGRVDRIDHRRDGGSSGFVMVDYKSGKPGGPGVGDEEMVLALYLQAAVERGHAIRGARLDFVLDGENRVFDPDPAELATHLADAEALATAAASGEFSPRPGFHCRSCDYQLLCPARDR